MYCTPLLDIKELNDNQKETVDSFLQKFLPNGFVTVSKAVEYTGMQERIIIDIFSKLYLCGWFDIVYAVSCPECGHLIKKIKNKSYFDYSNLTSCYSCDEAIETSEKDVVTLFVKKENNPFGRGQYLNNELSIKQDGGIARTDSIEHLKLISETFASIVDMQANRYEKEDRRDNELKNIHERAYIRYKKNKQVYGLASGFFRVVSFLILAFVLYKTEVQGNMSLFVTVTIYVFQNVIDFFLKTAIVTDLNEIEREEMYIERTQKRVGREC